MSPIDEPMGDSGMAWVEVFHPKNPVMMRYCFRVLFFRKNTLHFFVWKGEMGILEVFQRMMPGMQGKIDLDCLYTWKIMEVLTTL